MDLIGGNNGIWCELRITASNGQRQKNQTAGFAHTHKPEQEKDGHGSLGGLVSRYQL